MARARQRRRVCKGVVTSDRPEDPVLRPCTGTAKHDSDYCARHAQFPDRQDTMLAALKPGWATTVQATSRPVPKQKKPAPHDLPPLPQVVEGEPKETPERVTAASPSARGAHHTKAPNPPQPDHAPERPWPSKEEARRLLLGIQ